MVYRRSIEEDVRNQEERVHGKYVREEKREHEVDDDDDGWMDGWMFNTDDSIMTEVGIRWTLWKGGERELTKVY